MCRGVFVGRDSIFTTGLTVFSYRRIWFVTAVCMQAGRGFKMPECLC